MDAGENVEESKDEVEANADASAARTNVTKSPVIDVTEENITEY